MAKSSEKRSPDPRVAGLAAVVPIDLQGVGGRQAPSPSPPRGGGYLSSCTTSNFSQTDHRLDELRTMGLAAHWIKVAEHIGFDAFDRLWRILDGDPALDSGRGYLELRLRPYHSYLRYQRNRYIEELVGRGLTPKEIMGMIRSNLGEVVSIRHISRIAKGK